MAKAPIKCSADFAKAIVECWRVDGVCGRISADVWGLPYQKMEARIRVMVPFWNKMANNALWDDNFQLAASYLVKYGLANNEAVNISHDKEIKRAKANYAQAMFSRARHLDQREHDNAMQSAAGIRRRRVK